MPSSIRLKRRWKEKKPMSACASNWSFSLKRYKNAHTGWWQIFRAAVCSYVQSQIISFFIAMLQWVCDCFIFTCISDCLLLNSTIQVLFFIALVFFNVFWEVLHSKVFNCCRFALEGWKLGRGISSQFKSFSILLVSLKICLSLVLLSKTCGDGPRPTDCSPFIRFCHFALNLVDSAMLQCMLHQLRRYLFSTSFDTCLSWFGQTWLTNIMGAGFKCHDP